MFGKLKSSWSEWSPVLQQLPSAAVEGVKSGFQSAAGRSSNSSNSKGGGGASVSAARIGATRLPTHDPNSNDAHITDDTTSTAPATAAPSSTSSTTADSNVTTGGGQKLYSFGSKLASNLKEGWRNKVGGGGGNATIPREEEHEQRSFLIPPSTPVEPASHGGIIGTSAAETKLSKNGVAAFSFDDEPTSASHPSSPNVQNNDRQTRAALFGSAASSSAASASTAASSSTARAASSSSVSSSSRSFSSSTSAASKSPSGFGSDSATIAAFSSLPKLSSQGSATSFSSTAAATKPFASSSGGSTSTSTAASTATGDGYVQAHALAAANLEAQQDELLEDMGHSIARLSAMSSDINTALTTQNAALDELGEEIDFNASSLEMVNKKMSKLLKKSSQTKHKHLNKRIRTRVSV